MKKNILLLAATMLCTFSFAQHTQTQSKTEITNKAMLDGKVFAVTLTENSTGVVGTPGNMNNDKMMENPDMTKRDMGEPNKTGTMTSDLKDGRRMLIRFEKGFVKTSGKGEIRNEKCVYNSWGMESTGISYSADCNAEGKSDMKDDKTLSKVKTASTLLTGTVNGDTIHGTMTCTKEDGTVKTYSYTGEKAGQNDLDMESEMGMK